MRSPRDGPSARARRSGALLADREEQAELSVWIGVQKGPG